jgi:hypothetical protein
MVIGPEDLVADPPDAVVVLNQNYVTEIRDLLASLHVEADLLTAEAFA